MNKYCQEELARLWTLGRGQPKRARTSRLAGAPKRLGPPHCLQDAQEASVVYVS